MSLNWNVGNVKKPDLWVKRVDAGMGQLRAPLPDDKPEVIHEYLNQRTEALIWLTMAVGMHSITEATWKEFYIRLRMLEAIRGNTFIDGPVKPELIREHIGLETNASQKTTAAFMKGLRAAADDEFGMARL